LWGSFGICTAIIKEHNPYREEFERISQEFNNLIKKLDEDNKFPNSRPFILSIDLKLDYKNYKPKKQGGKE